MSLKYTTFQDISADFRFCFIQGLFFLQFWRRRVTEWRAVGPHRSAVWSPPPRQTMKNVPRNILPKMALENKHKVEKTPKNPEHASRFQRPGKWARQRLENDVTDNFTWFAISSTNKIMLCNAMGGYGDSLCAFHADRSKRITNKNGRNRQEREHREEDHHPPRAELRMSPENLAFGKNCLYHLEFKLICLLFGNGTSGVGCQCCGVWYVLTDLLGSCLCAHMWNLQMFRFPVHIAKIPWCLAKGLQLASLSQWIWSSNTTAIVNKGPHMAWHLSWRAFLTWLRLLLVEWVIRCMSWLVGDSHIQTTSLHNDPQIVHQSCGWTRSLLRYVFESVAMCSTTAPIS